jgi:hypothetical protein
MSPPTSSSTAGGSRLSFWRLPEAQVGHLRCVHIDAGAHDRIGAGVLEAGNGLVRNYRRIHEMNSNGSPSVFGFAGAIGITLALVVLASPSAQAQTGTLFVEGANVGIGTAAPAVPLHVRTTDGTGKVLVEVLGGGSFEDMMELYNEDGDVGFRLRNPSGTADFNKVGTDFRINIGSSPAEMILSSTGNLTIRGSLTTQNPPGTFPDFVFEPDHELMPLAELRRFVELEKHLPGVMSAAEVAETGGVNLSRLQLQLLEKVEELTLYILEQNETIEAHQDTIQALEARLGALEQDGF